MTPPTDPHRRLDEESRFDLSAFAADAERRNRPKQIVVLGIVLLVAALGFTGYAAMQYRSANVAADRARVQSTATARVVTEIRALQNRTQTTGAVARKPDPNFLSTVQRLARESGVTADIAVPRPAEDKMPNRTDIVRNRWRYQNISDENPEDLLKWMLAVRDAYPGTTIDELSLTPRGSTFRMSVSFARWEETSD